MPRLLPPPPSLLSPSICALWAKFSSSCVFAFKRLNAELSHGLTSPYPLYPTPETRHTLRSPAPKQRRSCGKDGAGAMATARPEWALPKCSAHQHRRVVRVRKGVKLAGVLLLLLLLTERRGGGERSDGGAAAARRMLS